MHFPPQIQLPVSRLLVYSARLLRQTVPSLVCGAGKKIYRISCAQMKSSHRQADRSNKIKNA
jgi:hypothetical protein